MSKRGANIQRSSQMAPIARLFLGALLLIGGACEGPTADPSNASMGAAGDSSASLTVGARGEAVRQLHDYLTRFGYFPNADLARRYPAWRPLVPVAPAKQDVFDASTADAVSRLQALGGIPVSGQLDGATRDLMRMPRCGVPEGIAQLDPSDKFDYLSTNLFPSNSIFPATIGWGVSNTDTAEVSMLETRSAMSSALATWSAQASITFTESTTITPRIDVFSGPIDGNGKKLAQMFASTTAYHFIEIDTGEFWSASGSPLGYQADLQSVLVHEVGHALGLEHSGNAGIMYPFYNFGTLSRTLSLDDNLGISSIWDNVNLLTDSANQITQANDIAVNRADGSMWKIGTNPFDDGFQVYKWSGSSWVGANAGGTRIAIAPNGAPWIVTSTGRIVKKSNGGVTGTDWNQVGNAGIAKDIGIGPVNGEVWVVGFGNGDQRISKLSGSTLLGTDGFGTRVTVAASGKPWVVNSAGQAWRRLTADTTTTAAWQNLPGPGGAPTIDLGIGEGEFPWALFRINGGVSLGLWEDQDQAVDSMGAVGAVTQKKWVLSKFSSLDGAGWNLAAGRYSRPMLTDGAGNVWFVPK
jgi:hypothetical protein